MTESIEYKTRFLALTETEKRKNREVALAYLHALMDAALKEHDMQTVMWAMHERTSLLTCTTGKDKREQ
jgi:hypothetical protein